MSVVYFLNVGKGDCSIIKHNSGRLTMIDINRVVNNLNENIITSNSGSSIMFNESRNPKGNYHQDEHPIDPIKFLKDNYSGEELFRFILTHPDMDHLKGFKALSKEIGFINFWSYKNDKDSTNIKKDDLDDWNFYQELLGKNKLLKLVDTNNCQYLPDDDLTILSPNNNLIEQANNKKNWNDASAVILYKAAGYKFLFCGDSGDATWKHLIKNHRSEVSNIDIFFAPHHGRDSDRDFEFLDIVKPRITILGNAESNQKADDQYRDKSLYKFSNTQAGNFKFEINSDNKLEVYFSNKKFAESFCSCNNLNCIPQGDWFGIGVLDKNDNK